MNTKIRTLMASFVVASVALMGGRWRRQSCW